MPQEKFSFNRADLFSSSPYTHKGPLGPRRIGIVWDGSHLAARALRNAAPFLTCAQAITIISINEAEASSAETLTAHLAGHGLTAHIESMTADRADIQPTILSIAADTGLDLIVMGGYDHSHLQERILVGVTRGISMTEAPSDHCIKNATHKIRRLELAY
jgi:hypothetical protein